MSLSPSDNTVSYSRAPPPGKTPPPAPSAAFAKRSVSILVFTLSPSSPLNRAREIQAEERLGGRYLPPALRALASAGSPPNDHSPSVTTPVDGSALPPTNYQPAIRRPRAGTLPSNVQLAAQQRFAAASNTVTSTSTSTDSLVDPPQRLPMPPTPPILPAHSRPGLRHATSVASTAASSAATERNSRLRSGSLTLPSAGLSNAFGSSIFSSSWLSSTNTAGNGFAILDELRSVASQDSGADDFDVHTLDYLGLDDYRPPPAATISELRNQAQAAIAGNLAGNPSRMRASTVSNPYHARASMGSSLLPTAPTEEDEEFFDDYNDQLYARQHLAQVYDGSAQDSYPSNSYMNKGFKNSEHLTTRPRAISVGTLDEPMRSLQQRRAAADSHAYELASGLAATGNNGMSGPASILKSLAAPSRSGASPTVHFPSSSGTEITGRGASAYLIAPSSQSRSLSPKSEGPPSQTQTPTRSLWIGNLDSAVTSEQLIHVFAPYGAIESLRLLPEKVCRSET